MIRGIRRAWALVQPPERRRLRWVAIYGAVIAALDAFALVLIYALINLLNDQKVTGIAGSFVRALGVGTGDRYHAALILLVITCVLFVARSLLSVLGLWLTVGASNAAQADLITRLLLGHARAPQLLRLERNSSEMLRTIMGSVDQVVSGIVFSSVLLVANLAVALAVAVGLILSSPVVAAAVSVYFVLIAVAWARAVRGGLSRRGRRMQELAEERYRLVLQGISAAKELQLRGRALFYAEGAAERTRGINDAARGATVANGSLRYLLETSLVVGAVVVVAVAGLTDGRASALPAVGLVLAGAFRFLPALNQILFLNNSVQFNLAATDVVEHELASFGPYANAEKPVDDIAPYRFERELVLDDITFRYPTRDEPALRDVAFAIRAGESFGIVGPTGSGKSTLLDVLLGMLEPESGTISLDGRPLSTLRDAWQRSIGYVPQDVYLVDDTLRANVALGWYGGEIDEARVLDAIHLAGLDDVVAGLPNGVDTVVGERGVRLSGGQRQRVGLARALYTRPSVLVLDEATSNLDQATEHRIVETLAELRGGVTMIVVTHRQASVRHCDRLLYLEHGRVRAIGTFDEIHAAVPEFGEPEHTLRLASAG
ncbi:MAG TPA: ABC transporter ATP-binding protein [Gaiellaceae bacterium]|nr:ABC transporter ATP-binding protein [Gaiellaceae bacterium]